VKRNKIDCIIPSDISDTFMLSANIDAVKEVCKLALCPSVKTYESFEDKWCTYNFCMDNGIPTPTTKKLDEAKADGLEFPFFLKVSSGTNGGRGVWLIKDQTQLDSVMKEKVNVQCTNDPENSHLAQSPTFGTIVCAEVVYDHGKPLGFWFSQSNSAEDLAGVGKSYIFSCCTKKGAASHVGVEFNDEQWEAVTGIFQKVGVASSYHGMIDIEFIIAGPDNPNATPGSVWLLEFNPRFSGAVHTTLSDLGFLDLYMDVMMGTADREAPIINFCTGNQMRADFREFSPASFYAGNPLIIATARNWKRGPFSDMSIKLKGKAEPTHAAQTEKIVGNDEDGNEPVSL
jgi:carbamoylphosphate synthase large subunit